MGWAKGKMHKWKSYVIDGNAVGSAPEFGPYLIQIGGYSGYSESVNVQCGQMGHISLSTALNLA